MWESLGPLHSKYCDTYEQCGNWYSFIVQNVHYVDEKACVGEMGS